MKNKAIKRLYPPSTIGIVGGGQLGRMIAMAAKRMGYNVVILDPKRNSPAGQVADRQITAEYGDFSAIKELAGLTDVITYEFEHIDANHLEAIEKSGYSVYPSARTLKLIQNKYVQKKMLRDIGVATPKFHLITDFDGLKKAFDEFGGRAVLKTCRQGYDGKGNIIVKQAAGLRQAYREFSGREVMVEEFIDFDKEAAIIAAKNCKSIEFYPVTENVHKNSILIKSTIPAAISKGTENKIREICKKVLSKFDDYGVFCIEFFIDKNSNVLVNEIAPRPHNSGHYSIEGCACSQFEQLVRVICGMPLGSAKLKSPCSMYNILGSPGVDGSYQVNGLNDVLSVPDCHFHLYGKPDSRHLRKIGHITALDVSAAKAEKKAGDAFKKIRIAAKKKD